MKCLFCGAEIPKGKGIMYVRKDGKILYFDKRKCYNNYLKLKRSPTRTRWTNYAHKEKERLKKAREKKAMGKKAVDNTTTPGKAKVKKPKKDIIKKETETN